MLFKIVLCLSVSIAVLGMMTEGREIHQHGADPSSTESPLDQVKNVVKRSEDIKTAGEEAARSIGGAIMKSIENVKEKAAKTGKPHNHKRTPQEENRSSTVSSCCG